MTILRCQIYSHTIHSPGAVSVNKKILVIDDEPEYRSTLQDVLESKGYEVEGSPYLATSVGWGLTGDYDLITLDLRMPEVSGLK